MALENENGSNGFYMPVAPAYMGGGYGMNNGGFGFGGDGIWFLILFFLLAGNGGWGNGFGGGFGGGALGYDFPWLLNGQNGINNNVNDGFRDAQLHDSVTSVRDGVSALSTQLCGCCGDMQMSIANSTAALQNSLCNGFAGVNQGMASGFAGTTAAITGAQNAIASQLYNNEIANLNRSFAEQTANMQGFNGANSGIADTRYTIATEACATRTNDTQNTQSILTAMNAGIQSIKDQLCQDKIDAKNDEIAQLRQEVLFARGQASQVDQTAQIRTAGATIANQAIQELRSCPIPAMPVYGNQAIFSCPQNMNNCGCGCGCNNM